LENPKGVGRKHLIMLKTSKILNKEKKSLDKVILKLESSYKNPISKNIILHLGHENNLNISSRSSFVNLKRRKKLSLTVLSGPHVHKKSREQFEIGHYASFFQINILNDTHYKDLSIFKKRLDEKAIKDGFEISFSHQKNEKIVL
jgi:ribosomal protein S10